jgi:hypothetical protein
MDVQIVWSGKHYETFVNVPRSLGGIIYEGRPTPFPGCNTLADLVTQGVLSAYEKPPKGLYFKCDASFCISLQKVD